MHNIFTNDEYTKKLSPETLQEIESKYARWTEPEKLNGRWPKRKRKADEITNQKSDNSGPYDPPAPEPQAPPPQAPEAPQTSPPQKPEKSYLQLNREYVQQAHDDFRKRNKNSKEEPPQSPRKKSYLQQNKEDVIKSNEDFFRRKKEEEMKKQEDEKVQQEEAQEQAQEEMKETTKYSK